MVTKIFLIDLCLLIQNLESYIDICSIFLSPLIWKSLPRGCGGGVGRRGEICEEWFFMLMTVMSPGWLVVCKITHSLGLFDGFSGL